MLLWLIAGYDTGVISGALVTINGDLGPAELSTGQKVCFFFHISRFSTVGIASGAGFALDASRGDRICRSSSMQLCHIFFE